MSFWIGFFAGISALKGLVVFLALLLAYLDEESSTSGLVGQFVLLGLSLCVLAYLLI